MSLNLTKTETAIKREAAHSNVACRTQPMGAYDAGVALAIEYIFFAAKAARAGDFEKAMTCARLAASFQTPCDKRAA